MEQNKVENKNENINNQIKLQEQNKNLNESIITTTSTSSISVNIKKNLPFKNYKTPKRKNFQIPVTKPKNQNQLNINNINTIVYTKGTIKKMNKKNIYLNSNKSINQTKLGVINEAIIKDDIISNELSEQNYFSNNESDINNKIKINENINKITNMRKLSLKEKSKLSSGYYSENEQRKEKNAILNIEEILMIEEKLSAIISCIQNGTTCVEECFDWFNSYFHTFLSSNIEKYFIKEEYIQIVKKAINLNVFSLMLCYDISFNEEAFNELQNNLYEIMCYNHMQLSYTMRVW